MKKDFIIILVLLSFAIFGVYMSCTGYTDSSDEKRIEKTTFNQIDVTLLVATNDETAAMGCPCRRKPGNLARCKAGKGDCASWSSWDEYTYCVSLHLESCR